MSLLTPLGATDMSTSSAEQMKRIQNDSDKINTHAEKAKKVLGDMEKFFGGIFGRKKRIVLPFQCL